MMIKPKSIVVIVLSSILISAVILLTISGQSLYLGWKEKESARLHRNKLALLNAILYGGLIEVEGLQAKYDNEGLHKGKCSVEGTIKNKGYRTVTSIKIAIEFLNRSGNNIYTERLYPLKNPILAKRRTIAALSLFTSGKEAALAPNEHLRFKHILGEQKEKSIISPIKYKRYATNPNEWSGKFNYRITEVRF